MNDQSLAGDQPASQPAGLPSLATAAVETVLDLDEVMSQARLVEKTARICLRGDLQGEYDELLEELANLVDADGNVLSDGDQALSDGSRAQQIIERQAQLHAEMADSMRTVRFRAMPDDDWRAWEKTQQDEQGRYKDPEASNTDLIARCAISPKMTVAQVNELRKKLGPTQIAELANKAYAACTTGGVDLPKSLTFSPGRRPQDSARS